jgi:hypothetical protein
LGDTGWESAWRQPVTDGVCYRLRQNLGSARDFDQPGSKGRECGSREAVGTTFRNVGVTHYKEKPGSVLQYSTDFETNVEQVEERHMYLSSLGVTFNTPPPLGVTH